MRYGTEHGGDGNACSDDCGGNDGRVFARTDEEAPGSPCELPGEKEACKLKDQVRRAAQGSCTHRLRFAGPDTTGVTPIVDRLERVDPL
jgi:hypothetical protein